MVILSKTETIPVVTHLVSQHTEKLERRESVASLKIQSIWRGQLARKKAKTEKRHALEYSLFAQAKPYIDTPSMLEDVPRASTGQACVYLPTGSPIVLKKSVYLENQQRFEKIK